MSVFIPHIFESLFIEINSVSNKPVNNIIGVIYRPNTQPKTDVDIFSSTVNDIIDIINDEKKTCLIMGDFNIDLLKYNINNKTNDLSTTYFQKGS